MANSTSQESKLVLLAGFVDEDDRSISLQNPVSGLTQASIESALNPYAHVLIGDKYQAQFSRFKSARYVTTVTTKYDLG